MFQKTSLYLLSPQILRADLLDRMLSHGVIANIQPQFVPTDARWLQQLLPQQLADYAYSWKSLFDKGWT